MSKSSMSWRGIPQGLPKSPSSEEFSVADEFETQMEFDEVPPFVKEQTVISPLHSKQNSQVML